MNRCARRSRTARANVFWSSSSSHSRPTNGAPRSRVRGRCRRGRRRARRPAARRRGPSARAGRAPRVSIAASVSRRATGPTRISPGAARLLQPRGDVDGLAGRERRVRLVGDDLARLDADPRLEPELVHGLEDRGAARTARSASSSCACGMPNAAITASPANFSTMPPCVAMQLRDLVEEARHAAAHDLRVARRRRARSSRRGRRRGRSRACAPSLKCSCEGLA